MYFKYEKFMTQYSKLKNVLDISLVGKWRSPIR